MYIQKLYKNGNSIAVTIPKPSLRNLDLRDGTKVIVEERGEELVIKAAQRSSQPEAQKKAEEKGVSREFKKWLKETLKEDAEILDELANR